MDLETQNPKNVYHIGGIPVEFPYKPYGSQMAFMARLISTLDRGLKQGHCHALLESPTGTGKSLSLLCSTLAWQQQCRAKNLYANLAHSKPNPEAVSDPLGHGGGFVPEPEPSGNATSEYLEPAASTNNSAKQRIKAAPKIYYASRTHSQISQVIREYRKTSYRVPMAVLAARKHYCTNRTVSGKENIDEECKLLLKDRECGCSEFKNAHKVKGNPSLQKGGCHEVHDIEDLVKVGHIVKGCSYFAARSMAEEAQLVFCPYSYIISPTIRRAMEVDLKGSIVIFDEAHNIEDMAREAGSVDVEEDVLLTLQKELEELCLADSTIYQPLYDMIEGFISWMDQRKSALVKREFQHYFSCWTGDKALRELQEASVSQQLYPILQECATKAIKAASDAESGLAHLSGKSVIALEALFSSLGYFFSRNGLHALDYHLVLQRCIKRDAGKKGHWTYSLSLWCMNPAVVFREIADLSTTVILASGTLSPMGSFSSELGVQFETCMEAPHVIDVESQLWAAVISRGPGNYPLNASYRTADRYDFQDELGNSLEEICKIVPGGALVFFPSYKLMEKLSDRWRETGQWCRLNAQKSIFTEPRGSQEDFELVLRGYYDSIRRCNGSTTWKIKRGRKRDLKNADVKEGNMQQSRKGGSAFLAVCRGKVSEGIDFSDDNARVVIIVGIPFPNINDIQVAQKKTFNDMYKSSKNLLSGSEWYCQQAFRALNQAAGRCIRHRFDYGAIIFIDERFKEERNIAYVSKWLRKSIKQYNSFDMSLEGLRSFFHDVKGRTAQNGMELLADNDFKEENNPSIQPKTRGTRNRKRRNQKTDELAHPSWQKLFSKEMSKTEKEDNWSKSSVLQITGLVSIPKLEEEGYGDLANEYTDEKDTRKQKYCSDFKCSPQRGSRLSEAISTAYCNESPEYKVKETLGAYDNITMASSVVISNNEISSSTVVAASHELPDQLLFDTTPMTKSRGAHSRGMPVLTVTPERRDGDISNPKSELESSLNLSVNSCTQKRRKPMIFSSINIPKMELFGNCHTESPTVECTRTTTAFQDSTCPIQFCSKADYNECDDRNANVPQMRKENCNDRSCLSSDVALDKKLHICCSLCRNPLGLPDNKFLVLCSLTSSSKDYLASFLRSRSPDPSVNESESLLVLISDIASIDHRLYNRSTSEVAGQNGVWCEKDGCVFRTVLCPFCTVSDHFLGLQILATDSPNLHLLNKILFYFDRLEIKNDEASIDKGILPVDNPDQGQTTSCQNLGQVSLGPAASIEDFSYQETSGGWRTTKSKLRLPRRSA